jgi:hypothetical protein
VERRSDDIDDCMVGSNNVNQQEAAISNCFVLNLFECVVVGMERLAERRGGEECQVGSSRLFKYSTIIRCEAALSGWESANGALEWVKVRRAQWGLSARQPPARAKSMTLTAVPKRA